ncbi:MFS transporter [Marivivens marinus]|uniref:MFS transporter n=1 Tax=Marivivens marinus TaxID=3110173 RepID=UPI003B845B6C
MRILISFAALFLSVVLLQIATGGVGPLDALVGLGAGFSKPEVGFLGSAHFFGFFIGCWWAPRLLGDVGHARSFATFTALGAIGLSAHVLVTDPNWWALFRVASGICVAGCYTVIEAWLQAKVTNENRGRAMGIYRVVDVGGSFMAQAMVGWLADLETYLAYNTLVILCCTALLPMAVTKATQPVTPGATRLRPAISWRMSPLATVGVVVAALSAASFRMVGPIYGQEIGLTADQIGYFLAFFVFGGAIAQIPVGWLADKFDRRWVLIWLSVAAVLSCVVTVGVAHLGTVWVMLAASFFGFTTFPIYSVSAAHAHDFASSDERVELSAALMFFYAVGAIGAPYVSSTLIVWFGPAALFTLISVGHILLIVFGLARMRARPAERRTRYVYAPRTSFVIGRLMGRSREKSDD